MGELSDGNKGVFQYPDGGTVGLGKREVANRKWGILCDRSVIIVVYSHAVMSDSL